MLHNGMMLTAKEIREASEISFRDDRLLFTTEKHNGTGYCEVREYRGIQPNARTEKEKKIEAKWQNKFLVRFAFITRIWDQKKDGSNRIKEILDILTKDFFPDVIVVNSVFWDIEKYRDRWLHSKRRFEFYSNNLERFLKYFNARQIEAIRSKKLKKPTVKIWRSSMNISNYARSGFIEADTDTELLKDNVDRANAHNVGIIRDNDWDLLDAKFITDPSVDLFQAADGIHWTPSAHRALTCSLLSHIAVATGEGLPTLPLKVNVEKGETRLLRMEYEDVISNLPDHVEVPEFNPVFENV